MKKVLLFLGSVLVLAACDRTPTAPALKLDAKSAHECLWYKAGDSGDSVQVCD